MRDWFVDEATRGHMIVGHGTAVAAIAAGIVILQLWFEPSETNTCSHGKGQRYFRYNPLRHQTNEWHP